MKKSPRFFLAFFLFLASASAYGQLIDYRLVPRDLETSFQSGIRLIKDKQFEAGFKSLDQALALLWTNQINDLPTYSEELIRLAYDPSLGSETEKRLLQYSFYLGPHIAGTAFAHAQLFLSKEHFSPGSALSELGRAVSLIPLDLLATLRIKAKIWATTAEFFRLGLLIVSALIIIRSFRVLFHWAGHKLPSSLRRLAVPAVLLIGFAPLYVGAPLWMALVWPALLCVGFGVRSVQMIFILFLLGFSVQNWFEQKKSNLIFPIGENLTTSQYRVGLGLFSRQDLNLLEAESAKSPTPGVILALADAERKAGNTQKAVELLRPLGENPEAGVYADNQLGCLYLESGQTSEGLRFLERAAASKEQFAEVYFNLSQAYGLRNAFDRSDHAYQRASHLDREAVERFRLAKKLTNSSVLMVHLPLPAAFIEKMLVRESDLHSIFASGKRGFLFLLAGSIFIFALSLGKRGKICFYCGRVICPKCLPESRAPGICGPCYQVFRSGKSVDPKLKIKQKGLVRSYHTIMAVFGILASVLVPGSGLVFEEKIFSGLIISILSVAFLASVFSQSSVPAPMMPVANLWTAWVLGGVLGYIALGLLSVVLYIILAKVEV